MDTDDAWKLWGLRDPYYAVLAEPQFRAAALTPATRAQFFASGVHHRDYVLATFRHRFDATFNPRRVLDFGCGVGRVVIPFSEIASAVVGVDIAPAMLAEARRNCDQHGIGNVQLVLSDDTLSALSGSFDLVHSSIVLQHLDVTRGRAVFRQLVDRVSVGGCGMLHVTFAWDAFPQQFGQPTPPLPPTWQSRWKTAVRKAFDWKRAEPPQKETEDADPRMDMHFYNMSELLFILQQSGIERVYTDFTNHGGAIGGCLFFQR